MKRFFNYFREVRDEMQKVTWPSKTQTFRYSVTVVIFCVVLGAFFAVLDLGLNAGLEQLLSL